MTEVAENDEFIAKRCRGAATFRDDISQNSVGGNVISNGSNVNEESKCDVMHEIFDLSNHHKVSCRDIDDAVYKNYGDGDDDTGSTTSSTIDYSERGPFETQNFYGPMDQTIKNMESTEHKLINYERSANSVDGESTQQLESDSQAEPSVPTIGHLSLFDRLDIMFEKLCFADTVCHDQVVTYACAKKSMVSQPYNFSLESIVSMLGCTSPSLASEFDYFSTLESYLLSSCGGNHAAMANQVVAKESTTKTKFPRRGRKKQHIVVQQLLLERGRTSTNSSNQLSSLPLRRVSSFSSIHSTFPHGQQQHRHLHGTRKNSSPFGTLERFLFSKQSHRSSSLSYDVLNVDVMDGYDSDPCLPYSKPLRHRSISPRSILVNTTPPPASQSGNKFWNDTHLLRETVELSMNCTWDLLWIHNNKPLQVQVWMERGTVIKNRSSMIEPCLMWRSTSSKTTSVVPMSLRLLHICRVRPVRGTETNNTSAPTMCRASTSLMVRTICQETHYFQASTIQECDSIVHQWKMAIARLATLAVLEDTATLIDEFFLDQHRSHEYIVY